MATLGVLSSLISLGELTVKCIRYVRKFQNAPKDAEAIAHELSVLQSYLQRLQNLIQHSATVNDEWSASLQQFNAPGGPVLHLVALLTNLATRLTVSQPRTKLQVFKRRALWPIIGKEEVEDVMRSIQRVTHLMMAAVQVDGIILETAIARDLESCKERLDLIGTHADFVSTLLIKSVTANNTFGLIEQAPRDLDADMLGSIGQWMLRSLNSRRQAPLAGQVKNLVLSGAIQKKLLEEPVFAIPKDYTAQSGDFQAANVEIVKFRGTGCADDELIMRVLPYLCAERLYSGGISIAWKALHDVATRPGAKPSHELLANLLIQELREGGFSAGIEVDLFVRANTNYVKSRHSWFIGLTVGEVIHISALFKSGGLWSDSHNGLVSPHLVDPIDASEDDLFRLAQCRAAVPLIRNTDPVNPNHFAEVAFPKWSISGLWWGEREEQEEWLESHELRQKNHIQDVNITVRASSDAWSSPQCVKCLQFRKGDIIHITQQCSDGWCWGKLGDVEGWIWAGDGEEVDNGHEHKAKLEDPDSGDEGYATPDEGDEYEPD